MAVRTIRLYTAFYGAKAAPFFVYRDILLELERRGLSDVGVILGTEADQARCCAVVLGDNILDVNLCEILRPIGSCENIVVFLTDYAHHRLGRTLELAAKLAKRGDREIDKLIEDLVGIDLERKNFKVVRFYQPEEVTKAICDLVEAECEGSSVV